MQEFESISASSYDPSALAAKITVKAAEGWSIIAIVPTGGDVTAFLSREAGGATEPAESESAGSGWESTGSAATESAAAAPDATVSPDVVIVAAEVEPASEPSGWAIAPEPSSPTIPERTSVQPTVTPEPASAGQAASTYEATPSYEPAPAAPAPEPVAVPAVPAGWYADPAGRFELRYWDGSTWSEHVSRAGQQFTDPPVA